MLFKDYNSFQANSKNITDFCEYIINIMNDDINYKCRLNASDGKHSYKLTIIIYYY